VKAGRGAGGAPPARVAFAPPEAWAGQVVTLSGAEHVHLARALRARCGDRIDSVDGAGGRALLEVVEVGRSATRCAVVSRGPAEPAARLALRVAPCLTHGPRIDWLVEKATELGVAEFAPVVSARSVVRRDARADAAHRARWERLAVAAMKQSRRAWLPRIALPLPLGAFLAARDPIERLIVPWEGASSGTSLGAHLRARPIGSEGRVALLVGPEGGLTEEEAREITAAGGELVALGGAILRSETAALAAVAIIRSAGGEI